MRVEGEDLHNGESSGTWNGSKIGTVVDRISRRLLGGYPYHAVG